MSSAAAVVVVLIIVETPYFPEICNVRDVTPLTTFTIADPIARIHIRKLV